MFRFGDDHVEIVESFIFLGSNIEVSGECKGGIDRPLALGRTAMSQLTKIWKDKDVTKQTKRRLVMIWNSQLQCMDVSVWNVWMSHGQ